MNVHSYVIMILSMICSLIFGRFLTIYSSRLVQICCLIWWWRFSPFRERRPSKKSTYVQKTLGLFAFRIPGALQCSWLRPFRELR